MDRLVRRIEELENPLCVGIDPVLGRIPAHIREEAARRHGQNERGAAAALYLFGAAVVDAVAPLVPAVKLQSAFFEAYGGAGVEAFWQLVLYARQKGLLVIADAKRGDIGSTAAAYADAFLGHEAPVSAWADPDRYADALTVNPYLGSDALEPFVKRAAALGRGLFVLVKTSNPGAAELQDQVLLSGETLALQAAKLVDALGAKHVGRSGFSAVGAVVGATYPEDLARLRAWLPHTFFLVPGYGAQGAGAAEVAGAFLPGGRGALVVAARSIIYAFSSEHAGPEEFRASVAAAARSAALDLRAAARRAT